MRVLHVSDLHLGHREPADAVGAGRLQSLRSALSQLAAESADVLLVAGDLFESPQVVPGVAEAARSLDRFRNAAGQSVPVVVIPGNHDPAEEGRELWATFNAALQADTQVHVVLKPQRLSLCGGRLLVDAYPCATRYSPEPPWAQALPAANDAASPVARVVVAHGTLLGGPVPEGETDAYPFNADDLAALRADYVALGHFHGIYPAWDGGEVIARGYCYCGTHEPDAFGSDAGWAIVAELEPGEPARLRRVRIARRQWRQIVLQSPADLARLQALCDEVENDVDPGRYVVRVKVDPRFTATAAESKQHDDCLGSLRALGAQVDARGELAALLDLASLDLSTLPGGAVKEALGKLRDDWQQAAGRERDVLAAAVQLGYGFFAGQGTERDAT